MVLDSKINAVREVYSIRDLHDWQDITPLQVMAVDGVGVVTLDHIRMYLASHNTTPKNDATPNYWKKNLSQIRIAQQISDSDQVDVAPFRVLVDTMEQEPFNFDGLTNDAGRSVVVPTEWKALGIRDGRFYQPMGDYSLEGYESIFTSSGNRSTIATPRYWGSAVAAIGSSTNCRSWPGCRGLLWWSKGRWAR